MKGTPIQIAISITDFLTPDQLKELVDKLNLIENAQITITVGMNKFHVKGVD